MSELWGGVRVKTRRQETNFPERRLPRQDMCNVALIPVQSVSKQIALVVFQYYLTMVLLYVSRHLIDDTAKRGR